MTAALPLDIDGDAFAIRPRPLLIWIQNYTAIESAFGLNFANGVLAALRFRASRLLGCEDVSLANHGGRRLLAIGQVAIRTSSGSAPEMERLLLALGREPVVVDGVAVLVALVVVSSEDDDLPAVLCGPAPCHDSVTYRILMQQAVAAFEALAANRLLLARQAIHSVDGGGVLYYECLARILSKESEGGVVSPELFVPAVETIGLIRLFDRAVVLETISALQRSPLLRLGCNISAQSAIDDEYWGLIFKTLAVNPQVATRLIVEITETSGLPNIEASRAFIARLKRLGCRVAVDDFGAGCRSISQVLALGPDIIKIDGSLLREAADRILGDELLSSLISLSACLAGQVVVEGIEGGRDLALARRAGARWVQGCYVDCPSRDWRDVSAADPLALLVLVPQMEVDKVELQAAPALSDSFSGGSLND